MEKKAVAKTTRAPNGAVNQEPQSFNTGIANTTKSQPQRKS
jgi:hypothetical protein